MSDKKILELWKQGYDLSYICHEYKKIIKRMYNKSITLWAAQQYIEPIIFKYQVDLMK